MWMSRQNRVTVKEIDQHVVMVGNGDKQRMLEHLLRDDEVSRAIVFNTHQARCQQGGP